MLDRLIDDNKLQRKFDVEKAEKSEIFHSNGAAEAQNKGIGTASVGLTMAERKAIEEKRKFVQKYNNSKIFSSTYGLRHAKKYVPRTEGGANALFDSGSSLKQNVDGDAHGNVRGSFGRSEGNSEATRPKIGFSDPVNPTKPSSAPVSRPKPFSF